MRGLGGGYLGQPFANRISTHGRLGDDLLDLLIPGLLCLFLRKRGLPGAPGEMLGSDLRCRRIDLSGFVTDFSGMDRDFGGEAVEVLAGHRRGWGSGSRRGVRSSRIGGVDAANIVT
ncbi:MAG: hypothetical protein QM597_08910 [Aeromicrobium sp.]|uniref:hypothetical protein n=1 Tax=Aeromicrobium sp. TaxID=1871063 RepID=UPI0039E65377